MSALSVIGIGILDRDPIQGIVDFGTATMVHIAFNEPVYDPAQLTNGTKMFVHDFDDDIVINGRTAADWNNDNASNVVINVKTNTDFGQYLEVNMEKTLGLINIATNNTMIVKAGFSAYSGQSLTDDAVFVYKGQNVAANATGVGIFDRTPNEGIVDFGSATLVQMTFDKLIYDPSLLVNGSKLFVHAFDNHIVINGQTVTAWNNLNASNVAIHVRTNPGFGQYLEVNMAAGAGLADPATDNTIIVKKGCPAFDGSTLAYDAVFTYAANQNLPFAKQAHTQLAATGIGIFDRTPNEGIVDFGSATLVQMTFNKPFYDPSQLTNGSKLFVHDFDDYIVINGRTVAQWIDGNLSNVMIHVRTSQDFGQYLEVNMSDAEGLVAAASDNRITVNKGFPDFGGTAIEADQIYHYIANNNVPFTLINLPFVQVNRGSAKPLRGAFAGWDFADSVQGFTVVAGLANLSAANGVLSADVTSSSAALLTPGDQNVPCKPVRTVELRLKSESCTSVKLYWDDGTGFDETRSAAVPVTNDNVFHDYQIELGQVASWTGYVKQFKIQFAGAASGTIALAYFKLTGVYFVPFPFLTGNEINDMVILNDIKTSFANAENTAVVGYSIIVEYLACVDDNGDFYVSGNSTFLNPAYYLRLAKLAAMPVMLWLRGDPWGFSNSGAYKQLMADDHSVMWTQALDATRFYRNWMTGYGYLSLAEKDLAGQKTPYWTLTEKLLGQCAEAVASLIAANPHDILGVTTTSELKFNAEEPNLDLDYNPHTIAEFRDACKTTYSSNLTSFNSAAGTSFTTWDLKSTGYDPSVVDHIGGFDAPRIRDSSDFWDMWKSFRGAQVKQAVQHMVNIVAAKIDAKLIYTHQIAIGDDPFCSPAEAGDAAGANVGIDMFNHEATEVNVAHIAGFVANDCARSWGSPEWLGEKTNTYADSLTVINRMDRFGVKYVCPFNWGAGDTFDFQNSQGELACRRYLVEKDAYVNYCAGAATEASSGEPGFGADQAVDASCLRTYKSKAAPNETQWLSIDIGVPRTIGRIVLQPADYGVLFPASFTIETSSDNVATPANWTIVTTQTGQNHVYAPLVFTLTPSAVRHIRVTSTTAGAAMQLAEVQAYEI